MPEVSPNIEAEASEASQTPAEESQTLAEESPAAPAQLEKHAPANPEPVIDSLSDPAGARRFPPYTRSLLKVNIPIVVTLAERKQKLGRILEIGPGQIIQFEKSCDEMLTLEAGNCKIASGEAIKVGDKFGLRIVSIIPSEERFITVKPT